MLETSVTVATNPANLTAGPRMPSMRSFVETMTAILNDSIHDLVPVARRRFGFVFKSSHAFPVVCAAATQNRVGPLGVG